jgi:hypothetical protein
VRFDGAHEEIVVLRYTLIATKNAVDAFSELVSEIDSWQKDSDAPRRPPHRLKRWRSVQRASVPGALPIRRWRERVLRSTR